MSYEVIQSLRKSWDDVVIYAIAKAVLYKEQVMNALLRHDGSSVLDALNNLISSLITLCDIIDASIKASEKSREKMLIRKIKESLQHYVLGEDSFILSSERGKVKLDKEKIKDILKMSDDVFEILGEVELVKLVVEKRESTLAEIMDKMKSLYNNG